MVDPRAALTAECRVGAAALVSPDRQEEADCSIVVRRSLRRRPSAALDTDAAPMADALAAACTPSVWRHWWDWP